jgi:NADH-quinone oxidoreductase subunit G
MTVTTNAPTGGVPAERPADHITVTIDDVAMDVPKGTLVIRAAEMLGVAIPRFCDHPLLDPVAACRMCLVEIEGQPKPQPSCAIVCTDGMVIKTQMTSPVADKAQQGVMEFLLINHPLDCPVCDKGGECPLQNQAMTNGRGETRFDGVKRTFPKPINVSAQILLDRERCVSCARCTRFADEIAGDPFIELLERGARQQVGIAADTPFDSYFSGNTIQICPVGALTSAKYRFRARPFDLVSSPTVCEHCASGCNLRTDHRRGTIMRRLAWDKPEVNEEWNCDKGRFAFPYVNTGRLTHPLVRDEDGSLRPASWPEALDVAARGLAAARGSAGVLTGGRLTTEDAYMYARFARVALQSDDIDFRARVHSDEEAQFLAGLAGTGVSWTGTGVTYSSLEQAPTVLLVAFEPEEESPIIFLRLRKAWRKRAISVFGVAAFMGSTLAKMRGTLIAAGPGQEAAALDSLSPETMDALRQPGAVILVGERAAASAGLLSAVSRLASSTGASLAWVPRRAGERGSLDAGALAGLLPGGRPLGDPTARNEIASLWSVDAAALPSTAGRHSDAIIAAASSGSLGALVVAGVGAEDLPDPEAFVAALDTVPFLISLETRHTEVTERADVVLPVATAPEKAGSFTNWEGRNQAFGQVLREVSLGSDARVLADIADEIAAIGIDVPMFPRDLSAIRSEMTSISAWSGARTAAPTISAAPARPLADGQLRLATWRHLLDEGRLQENEPFLAATSRLAQARMSAASAARVGAADGALVTLSTERGMITLPVLVTAMADDVVFVPTHSAGSSVHSSLGIRAGDAVRITVGGAA